MEEINKYLEQTGQTFVELMAGGLQYGPDVISDLVSQALAENKKIVWTKKLVEGQDLGLLNYELQPI